MARMADWVGIRTKRVPAGVIAVSVAAVIQQHILKFDILMGDSHIVYDQEGVDNPPHKMKQFFCGEGLLRNSFATSDVPEEVSLGDFPAKQM